MITSQNKLLLESQYLKNNKITKLESIPSAWSSFSYPQAPCIESFKKQILSE